MNNNSEFVYNRLLSKISELCQEVEQEFKKEKEN